MFLNFCNQGRRLDQLQREPPNDRISPAARQDMSERGIGDSNSRSTAARAGLDRTWEPPAAAPANQFVGRPCHLKNKLQLHIHDEQNATLQGPMADSIDINEISGCTCLRARPAARLLSRLYAVSLEPTGVTINQFGLLAKLFGASLRGMNGLSLGRLAELVGMHYSTLNRDIKPLKRQGFVSDVGNGRDGRVRTVCITEKGQAKLHEAVPAWRQAHMHLQDVLGHEVTLSLNGLLDLACDKA